MYFFSKLYNCMAFLFLCNIMILDNFVVRMCIMDSRLGDYANVAKYWWSWVKGNTMSCTVMSMILFKSRCSDCLLFLCDVVKYGRKKILSMKTTILDISMLSNMTKINWWTLRLTLFKCYHCTIWTNLIFCIFWFSVLSG